MRNMTGILLGENNRWFDNKNIFKIYHENIFIIKPFLIFVVLITYSTTKSANYENF
jgi:hypothetical protein